MKNLKDFFYDKNDIILVLLILVMAGLLIFWRVDVIMSYPDTIDKATSKERVQKATAPSEKTDEEISKAANKTPEKLYDKDGKLTKNVTVTIASDTVDDQVHYLVEEGLFKDYGDFDSVCQSLDTDPVKIKASTFTFSKGATREDIARIVTSD